MNQETLIIILVAFGGMLYLSIIVSERRKSKKLLADIRSGKRKPIHHDFTIQWDETGFVVRNEKKSEDGLRLSWADIQKITAYQRDLFTVDLICLFFERNDNTGVEVHEESNRWLEFLEALPKYLNGCRALHEWLWNVTVPAFAPNTTIIFERKTGPC